MARSRSSPLRQAQSRGYGTVKEYKAAQERSGGKAERRRAIVTRGDVAQAQKELGVSKPGSKARTSLDVSRAAQRIASTEAEKTIATPEVTQAVRTKTIPNVIKSEDIRTLNQATQEEVDRRKLVSSVKRGRETQIGADYGTLQSYYKLKDEPKDETWWEKKVSPMVEGIWRKDRKTTEEVIKQKKEKKELEDISKKFTTKSAARSYVAGEAAKEYKVAIESGDTNTLKEIKDYYNKKGFNITTRSLADGSKEFSIIDKETEREIRKIKHLQKKTEKFEKSAGVVLPFIGKAGETITRSSPYLIPYVGEALFAKEAAEIGKGKDVRSPQYSEQYQEILRRKRLKIKEPKIKLTPYQKAQMYGSYAGAGLFGFAIGGEALLKTKSFTKKFPKVSQLGKDIKFKTPKIIDTTKSEIISFGDVYELPKGKLGTRGKGSKAYVSDVEAIVKTKKEIEIPYIDRKIRLSKDRFETISTPLEIKTVKVKKRKLSTERFIETPTSYQTVREVKEIPKLEIPKPTRGRQPISQITAELETGKLVKIPIQKKSLKDVAKRAYKSEGVSYYEVDFAPKFGGKTIKGRGKGLTFGSGKGDFMFPPGKGLKAGYEDVEMFKSVGEARITKLGKKKKLKIEKFTLDDMYIQTSKPSEPKIDLPYKIKKGKGKIKESPYLVSDYLGVSKTTELKFRKQKLKRSKLPFETRLKIGKPTKSISKTKLYELKIKDKGKDFGLEFGKGKQKTKIKQTSDSVPISKPLIEETLSGFDVVTKRDIQIPKSKVRESSILLGGSKLKTIKKPKIIQKEIQRQTFKTTPIQKEKDVQIFSVKPFQTSKTTQREKSIPIQKEKTIPTQIIKPTEKLIPVVVKIPAGTPRTPTGRGTFKPYPFAFPPSGMLPAIKTSKGVTTKFKGKTKYMPSVFAFAFGKIKKGKAPKQTKKGRALTGLETRPFYIEERKKKKLKFKTQSMGNSLSILGI